MAVTQVMVCPPVLQNEIIGINEELKNNPGLVNSDPENKAWFMKIKLDNTNELNELMDAKQYEEMIKT